MAHPLINAVLIELREAIAGFMEAWRRHEHAPRRACPECWFESTDTRPSHAPGCSRRLSLAPTAGPDPRRTPNEEIPQ